MSVAYTAGSWTGEVLEEWIGVSSINTTWINGVDVDNNFLPNYFNTNLKLAYDSDVKDHPYQVALFITNLLNRDPMRIPSYNSRTGSQTVSDNYDAYGRSYTLSVNFRW
jgi:outer membrane receptor protein involved in Fe transport